MYQKEEAIDVGIIASDIAKWAINHYGYFVKSSNDKLEMLEEFTRDLSRLPKESLSYVTQVKDNWIDNGNTRPPSIPEFIKHLRSEYNQRAVPQIAHTISETFDYAGSWNAAESKGLKSAEEWMKHTYNVKKVSPATKYVIREFFLKNGYDFRKTSVRLGMMK